MKYLIPIATVLCVTVGAYIHGVGNDAVKSTVDVGSIVKGDHEIRGRLGLPLWTVHRLVVRFSWSAKKPENAVDDRPYLECHVLRIDGMQVIDPVVFTGHEIVTYDKPLRQIPEVNVEMDVLAFEQLAFLGMTKEMMAMKGIAPNTVKQVHVGNICQLCYAKGDAQPLPGDNKGDENKEQRSPPSYEEP